MNYKTTQFATLISAISVPIRRAFGGAELRTFTTSSGLMRHQHKTSPDLVVRAQADPVRDRPVLLHLLAKGHLGAEGLVGRLAKREWAV